MPRIAKMKKMTKRRRPMLTSDGSDRLRHHHTVRTITPSSAIGALCAPCIDAVDVNAHEGGEKLLQRLRLLNQPQQTPCAAQAARMHGPRASPNTVGEGDGTHATRCIRESTTIG